MFYTHILSDKIIVFSCLQSRWDEIILNWKITICR